MTKKELPPLNIEQVAELLSRSQEARRSILVGGQALNLWAVRYQIRPVDVMVSADIDMFGSAHAATSAGVEWGAQISLPDFDNPTPNTALLTLEFFGGKREIDFINGVMGVDTQELERLAIDINIAAPNPISIRIMHPLHCMISQIENAYDKKLNRRANPKTGDWVAERAKVSVEVLNKNLSEYVDKDDQNTAKRLVEKIGIFARRPSALEAYFKDGIDVLSAIPRDHSGWKERFAETVFSPIEKRIERRRKTYADSKRI